MTLVSKVKEDPAMCDVAEDVIRNLIHNLVDRVLNATVGGQVKLLGVKNEAE